jgi:hypothetical protein
VDDVTGEKEDEPRMDAARTDEIAFFEGKGFGRNDTHMRSTKVCKDKRHRTSDQQHQHNAPNINSFAYPDRVHLPLAHHPPHKLTPMTSVTNFIDPHFIQNTFVELGRTEHEIVLKKVD